MMFDSVREEMQVKITSGRLPASVSPPRASEPPMPVPTPFEVRSAPQVRPAVGKPVSATAAAASPIVRAPAEVQAPSVKRVETTDLIAPKTSPTLVGFQSKNPTIPDWRLQLQNAVQQRRGVSPAGAAANVSPMVATEPTSKRAAEAKPDVPKQVERALSDPRVANAMNRINTSRNTFLAAKPAVTQPKVFPQAQSQTHQHPQVKPFKLEAVLSPSEPIANPALRAAQEPEPVMPATRPAAAPRARIAPITVLKRDTNKLPDITAQPPIPAVEVQPTKPAFLERNGSSIDEYIASSELTRIHITAERLVDDEIGHDAVVTEDIEDLAHLSMRFGAGLFDLIIGSFVSAILLSPVAFTRSDWFSAAGLLAFGGVLAIVMFTYMTICVGFFGKTLGMRLFALELVDAVENEYPTLHQAAVSSSVYILSLILGGAGFLTVLFNEEKRAAHDLLSGTILVREF